MNPGTYHTLADLVLIVHVLYVALVVFGLVLIWWGGFRGWSWIRNLWFRSAHLAAIGGVVAQSWMGMECPMTTLENSLRDRAADPTYAGGFIAVSYTHLTAVCNGSTGSKIICSAFRALDAAWVQVMKMDGWSDVRN